jgi:DNA mismatch repair protein MutL
MPTALPTIALLDPLVANQIAAGEVVERPASVVKELVENSLDAGATRVRIALVEGGRQRIEIVDNGHGMGPEDARLAFARHATSKLRTAEELMAIGTFGFRGEALASVLAVAKVTLTTRRPSDAVGVRLTGAGSTQLAEEPAGCPVGTSLVVQDLFFNVPARLKFLRTPATELGQILRFVDALALARPDLHLAVTHNERKVCDYPPDPDVQRRAWAVLGAEVAGRLHPVQDSLDYGVRGLLSDPGLTHAGPGHLTLLVNGRPVQDRTLQHAIAAAYGTLLERGRYPAGVLALDCPADTVDVNVHPAKTEVRFVSSQAVHAAVTRAIRPMLAETPWVVQPLTVMQPPVENVETRVVTGLGPTPRQTSGVAWNPSPAWTPASSRSPARAEPLPLPIPGPFASLRYIGQAGLCFLVCEAEGALVLVDQHAAHERILFEQFVKAPRDQGFASQRLLIPATVPLQPAEVGALTEAAELLHQLGFDLEPSGERMVRVRAHPAVLHRDLVSEVQALAGSLLAGGRGQSTTQRLERTAATLACHAAVRAGDPMTAEAVAHLLRAMDGVDLAAYCPHGRPAVMRAKFEEIGKWFHRT